MRSKIQVFWFILALSMGVSVPANAAIFPGGPSLQIGGRVFTDLANLIILQGWTATANHYASLVQINAATTKNTGYQVTAGKTLSICAEQVVAASSSAATCQMQILFGTAAVIGSDASSAPTGASFPLGISAGGGFSFIATATSTTPVPYSNVFPVPATDFPAIQTLSTTGCVMLVYGYEAHDCSQ